MSKHTSDPTVVVRPRDKAIICNAEHGAGRCRKKVVSELGKVVCDNGHQIPVIDLFNAHLVNGLWTDESVAGIWPSVDAIRGIIDRITRPEFLRSTSEEWQHQIVSYWPVVSWLLNRAEHFDRKAAATLKDFLVREICEKFKIVGRYLDSMAQKDPHQSVRIREKILRCLGNLDSWRPTPEDYLGLWEIHHEAASYLGEEVLAKFYEHNVREATDCVHTDGAHCPLYFLSAWGNTSGFLDFGLFPDPCWRHSNWIWDQIRFLYRPDRGDIKWSVNHNGPQVAEEAVRKMFDRADKEWNPHKPVNPRDWSFNEHGPNKMRLNPPVEDEHSKADVYHLKPEEILDALYSVRNRLGGPQFGKHLFRQ